MKQHKAELWTKWRALVSEQSQSGQTTYLSVVSRHPGETRYSEPEWPDPKAHIDQGLNWTHFPVMNMHPHAWPLYSAAKLLGLEFNERGLSLKPDLPLEEYVFSSTLFGFKKSAKGYSNWYDPAVPGRQEVETHLPPSEIARMRQAKINGIVEPFTPLTEAVRLIGDSSNGTPLPWKITQSRVWKGTRGSRNVHEVEFSGSTGTQFGFGLSSIPNSLVWDK